MSDKNEEKENDLKIVIKDYGDESGSKIDIYDKDPKEDDHKSIHIKVDYENKSFDVIDNVKGDKETGSGSCFLTSACMNHFQKSFDDNCEELTILRWFRDTFVSDDDKKHYYEVAPAIVEAINRKPNRISIYNYIYDNVIKECVLAIKRSDYIFAYKRYKNIILALEEMLLENQIQDCVILTLKKTIR